MDNLEILQKAISDGIIDITNIQKRVEALNREKILEKHNYAIGTNKKGYYTYIKEDGKRKQVLRKSREDLLDYLLEYYEGSSKTNFGARYKVWMKRQELCGRSPETLHRYESDYKRFFKGYPIEKMEITDITEEIIVMHVRRIIEEKGLTYRATKELLAYFNMVFRKAMMDRIIRRDENPCEYIDAEMLRRFCKEPKQTRNEDRILSKQEVDALLYKLRNPNERMNRVVNFAIELAIFTGMRVGEIAALRWEDIDDEKITIRHSEKWDRKTNERYIADTKTHKIRTFPLTPEIKDVLRRTKEYELRMGYIGEFVFQDENGRVIGRKISCTCQRRTFFADGFTRGKSIHAIRRTLNSNLKAKGVSTQVAANLLGHTPEVNENNYTYDTMDVLEKLANLK